jgi:C4-dicarboxylate transporter, DctQ subunit
MSTVLGRAIAGVRKTAEVVVALLLGLMFLAFIVQIVLRYSLGLLPASAGDVRLALGMVLGWTSEISVVTWLYIVLLGSALWLREADEIKIDLLSGVLGTRGRRIVAAFTALAILILYIMSFPAILKYVQFMWRERTDFMKIRFDWLYSVYLVFAAAIILRYLSHLFDALRGRDAEDIDITKSTSGL